MGFSDNVGTPQNVMLWWMIMIEKMIFPIQVAIYEYSPLSGAPTLMGINQSDNKRFVVIHVIFGRKFEIGNDLTWFNHDLAKQRADVSYWNGLKYPE